MTVYNINVTRHIIDMSSPESEKACMIAQAIRFYIPGACSVNVRVPATKKPEAKFNIGSTRYHHELPSLVIAALMKFDELGPQGVKPFSFKINLTKCRQTLSIKTGPRPRKKKLKGHKPKSNCVRRYRALRDAIAA